MKTAFPDLLAALEAWKSLSSLGETRLAKLAIVRDYRLRNGLPNSPRGRGLALQLVLHDALDRLKPAATQLPLDVTLRDPRWRNFHLLSLRYIHGRGTDAVAGLIDISPRHFFRLQEPALAALDEQLWVMQQAAGPPVTITTNVIPRQKLFIGREHELAEYERLITTQHAVLLSGMFGIGKTALGAELMARCQANQRVIWLTLRPGLNTDIDSILREVGLHVVEDGDDDEFGRSLLLETETRRPVPLTVRINQLVSALQRGRYALCIDNMELVLGDAAVTEFLKLLWERGQRTGAPTLLFISRQRPEFVVGEAQPVLGGLTRADARQLVDKAGLAELSAASFDELYQVTAGGPMVLGLVAGAWGTKAEHPLSTPEGQAAFQQLLQALWHETDIHTYLLDRLYRGLDADALRVLEIMSVLREPLDDEDEAMLDLLAAQGVADSRQVMDHLFKLHLVSRLGSSGKVGLHPLVRGFVYSRLKGRPEARRRTHADVADWYVAYRKDTVEAAHHAYVAGLYERAAAWTIQPSAWPATQWDQRRFDVLGQLTEGEVGPALWTDVCLTLGDLLALQGQAQRASQVYQAGLKRLTTDAASAQGPLRSAILCHRLGRLHRSGDLPLALEWYTRALIEAAHAYPAAVEPAPATPAADLPRFRANSLGATRDSEVIAGIYIDGGGVLYQQAQYDACRDWCRQGLQMLDGTEAPFWQAQAWNILAHAAYSSGEFSQAEALYLTAWEISRAAPDLYHQAMTKSNLGNLYAARGEFERAWQSYTDSVQLKEQIGDLLGLGVTLVNLGMLSTKQGDLDQALAHLQRSMDIWRQAGSDYSIAVTHLNLATVYLLRGEVEIALENLMACGRLLYRIDGRAYLPELYRLFAQARLDRPAVARRWAERSLRTAEKWAMTREVAPSCRVLAQAHAASLDWPLARVFIERSLAAAAHLNDRYEQGQGYATWGDIVLAESETHPEQRAEARLAARGYWQTAVEIFTQLGARLDVVRVQAKLDRLGSD